MPELQVSDRQTVAGSGVLHRPLAGEGRDEDFLDLPMQQTAEPTLQKTPESHQLSGVFA
jgi:hypothetical protein